MSAPITLARSVWTPSPQQMGKWAVTGADIRATAFGAGRDHVKFWPSQHARWTFNDGNKTPTTLACYKLSSTPTQLARDGWVRFENSFPSGLFLKIELKKCQFVNKKKDPFSSRLDRPRAHRPNPASVLALDGRVAGTLPVFKCGRSRFLLRFGACMYPHVSSISVTA